MTTLMLALVVWAAGLGAGTLLGWTLGSRSRSGKDADDRP